MLSQAMLRKKQEEGEGRGGQTAHFPKLDVRHLDAKNVGKAENQAAS